MLRPPEEILQHIWQHRLLKPVSMYTVSGAEVQIVAPGVINHDSGPDFFNATLRIGDVTLSGNVEIHVRTSDWSRHGHEKDRAYDHIILHAVYQHDCEIGQNTEHNVEVLELRGYISEETLSRYEALASMPDGIPCARQLSGVADIVFNSWLERMAVERMEYKQAKFHALIHEFHGDYSQALYTMLLSAFGFKTNAIPFELLARQIPLAILLRHADNLAHVEALLAGTAGLFTQQLSDKYHCRLQNEYAFMQRKYKLITLRPGLIKYSRMRPANFPGLRLAQVAAIIHRHANLFTDPLRSRSYDDLVGILQTPASDFWRHHFSLGGVYVEREIRMGTAAAENIIINVIAPFLFYCGKKFGKEALCIDSLTLQAACSPENNNKTRHFAAKAHLVRSAIQSQGLINLSDRYCTVKQCLRCAIGSQIISGKVEKASAAVK